MGCVGAWGYEMALVYVEGLDEGNDEEALKPEGVVFENDLPLDALIHRGAQGPFVGV